MVSRRGFSSPQLLSLPSFAFNPGYNPLFMKLRNQLIALACLLIFAALGVVYVRMWGWVQKPRQIVVFVSDALSARSLAAARLYAGGADHQFELERFPHSALLRNASEDYAVPDIASAATALATGRKSRHGAVATTGTGRALDTILERAAKAGRAVGLITNGSLASPSIAAFYAHSNRPDQSEFVALQLYERDWVRVAFGGGAAEFLPDGAVEGAEGKRKDGRDGRRKDGRDLVKEWQEKGVQVVWSKAELENARGGESGRVVGLFGAGPLAYASQMTPQPSLADMTRRAIQLLGGQRGGYVLVVDAALFTSASEGNLAEAALSEVLALDKAVRAAVEEAGEKALILAVGRQSSGGLTLSGKVGREAKLSTLLGVAPEGYSYLSWASGPNGPLEGKLGPRKEPAAIQSAAGLGVAEDMLGLGRGPGSERVRGFLDNTAVFEILKSAL
jgi:alkaline phosphatase